MSLRRSTLTLVTASAVALSVFTPVAQAQSSDALTQLSDNITSSQILDDDGNPVDGNETWPGSSEGSSMLSSGDIPAAPSLSSSGKDTSDDDDEISEEQQALIGLGVFCRTDYVGGTGAGEEVVVLISVW